MTYRTVYSRSVPFWATIVAALDKLQAPHRIWSYVHQLISVITVATNEKKSTFVGLGFDFIESKCALQFRQVYLATSAAAFAASRAARTLRVGAATQDACSSSSLLARARAASRAWSSRAKSLSVSCGSSDSGSAPLLGDERFRDKSLQQSLLHELERCACELDRSHLPRRSPVHL
jgi:hypothetical protein